MIELSIIIVNYNVKEFLEQALLSIKKSVQDITHEIFVVDNDSTDGSVRLVHEKFPDVKLIINEKNIGYGTANNQALKLASGRYFVILNPDTVVQEDTFSVMTKFLDEHPDCGLVGCKILNPDGSLQLACRRSFPTPWIALTKISGLSAFFPKSKLFGKYNLTYLDPDETYEVEAVSGSFMVVRKEAIAEVGYFDEAFFMYGEDLDLCYRIREAGWKIYYLPRTKIIHFKGESSKKAPADLTIMFYRAMKLFVEKHYHSRYFHIPQWFLVTGIFIRAGITFLGKFLKLCLPAFIDLILLNVSLIIALWIRFGHLQYVKSYVIVTVIYSTIWLLCLSLMGVYTRYKFSSLQATTGVIIGFILNASLTFFFNQYAFSRAVVLIAGCLNIMFVSGWRFILKFLPRLGFLSQKDHQKSILLGRKTLVVGTALGSQKIVEKLRERVDGGYQIVGIISLNEEELFSERSGVRVLATIRHLDQIIRQERIQEVIFSTGEISYDDILELMAKTRQRGVNFKLVPRSMEVIIGKASIDKIDALPLVDIDYSIDKPFSIFMKRGTDLFVSSLVLLVSLPIFLYLRLIKKSRLRIKKYAAYNGQFVEVREFQPTQKKISPWLLHLPRFWSIFKGDISLVGAELRDYNEQTTNQRNIALKPGLMGLVQLNKDYSLTEEDRQRYDLFYLKNFSPILDLEIILKSIFKI